MTLRRRLTLLVALAVVVPLTAVGVSVVNLLRNSNDQRTYDRLTQSTAAGQAAFTQSRDELARRVQARAGDPRLAEQLTAGGGALDQGLRQALEDDDVDLVVVIDAGGAPAGSARRDPVFARGTPAPDDATVVDGKAGAVALVAKADIPGGGSLVAARWLDRNRLGRLAKAEDVLLAITANGKVVASSGSSAFHPPVHPGGTFRVSVGNRRSLGAGGALPGTSASLVAIASRSLSAGESSLLLVFVVVLLIMIVLIVLVGYVVSGLVTRPVQDLVEAATEVSRGNLDQRVDVKGDVEVATLGRAFNEMTDNLKAYVSRLEQSQAEFRQAMARLGDVLVSTHDLGGIVDVVLEACALTLGAEIAVFYERVAMPARIRATAAHGEELNPMELNGTGVAGAAAKSLGPVEVPGETELDPNEPPAEAALAVPVLSDGRLFGVLAVYGHKDPGPFRPEDVDTLLTLARQAEVAIGNVMLHDETRRQARTDGMTGLWNRREFELRCREGVREAARFGEPFGIILCDTDDFKLVNDRYDHSTGDAALIWVASRMSEAVREIDIVARWGGEEFIVLLPRAGVEETGMVAERVRHSVEREPMRHDDKVIRLTVSVGYAGYPHDGSTAEQLFKAADAALLRAKRLGKNRVERAGTPEPAA